MILVEESLVHSSIATFVSFFDLQESQSFVSSSDVGLWLQLFVVAWVVVNIVGARLFELRKIKIPRDNLSSFVGSPALFKVSKIFDDENLSRLLGVSEAHRKDKR